MKTDFIVIGSGLAGLTSALVLQKYGEVLLITKGKLFDCATNLAQGGIAAAVGEEDSFGSHIKDTLIAGCYHNNKRAVEYVVKNAPLAIEWLVSCGVHFDGKNGCFAPTREAAHSYKRVLHATDFTGKEIERRLVGKVKNLKNIKLWENGFVVDLLVKDRTCFGVQVIKDIGKIEVINIFSRAITLATGGLGQIYQWTTNPTVATGDGLAMAYRVGAELSDLEFIQFHPTALKDSTSPLFLLSEALRGEGAYLVKLKVSKEERFMQKYDKRAELAPRDIMARAIFREQQRGFEVYLDIRHKGKNFIKRRFPNIYLEAKKRGFDLASDILPVTPAAHYSCGGVKVDLFGRTNIANLFAFGEVSCAGVHGANRLASNSLLEAVVFPLRLEKCLSALPKRIEEKEFPLPKYSKKIKYLDIRKNLQKLMWEKVGIKRKRKDLQEAERKINSWRNEIEGTKEVNSNTIELKNMLLVARLVTLAALKRRKSLGAHFIAG